MNALIFLFSFLVAGAFADNATVQVTVYYESLCSDSIKFFINKLIPTYTQKDNAFSNISKLEIVPFGKANKTTDGYSCQHGPSECEGNKLHACAIKYITDQQMLLNYIGCLMNETTPVNKSKTLPYPDPEKVCTNLIGNVLVNISNCYKTQEGADLVPMNENKTTTFVGNNTFGVPFIAFNNKFDSDLSQKAQENYRKTLCSQAGLTNDYCSDDHKNGAAMLSSSVALISALLFSYYVRQ